MAMLWILHNDNLILKCKAMKYANIAQVLLSKYLLVRTNGIGYMNYNPQLLSDMSVLKSSKSFGNVPLSFDSSIHTLCCLE